MQHRKPLTWLSGILALCAGYGCSSDEPSAGLGGAGGSAGDLGGAAGVPVGMGGGGAGGGAGAGSEAGVGCDGARTMQGATVISGSLTQDTTWSGTVYLDGSVDLRDATLTISPGTHVVMGVDSGLEVGWNGTSATLRALGTAEAPVRFCGGQAEAGYWGSLLVRRNVTSDSVLSHVQIEDGGGEDAALILEADVDIDQLTVKSSGGDGVWADDFGEGSTGLSVEGSLGSAVVLTSFEAATRFPVGGTLSDNQEDVVRLRYSDITADVTFHALDVPYLQEEPVDVWDAVVTVDAGVDYRFAADADLEVGWNGSDATLLVNGTEAEPVTFQGGSLEPGYWGGLIIGFNVRTNSALRHVRLLHAGSNASPALQIDSAIIVDNVSLDQNETGMLLARQGLDQASTRLSVTGTSGVPLRVAPDALITLPTGGSFTGNADDHIEVEAGDFTVAGTVPGLGVPYRVLGSVESMTNSSMTLSAGTEFVITADARFEIGWNGSPAVIIAEGTAEAPIRFRGAAASAGYWTGLIFGNEVGGGSRLSYVEIAHGGGGSDSACLLLRNPVDVTNVTFSDCAGYGVLREELDVTDYATGNTFTNMGTGSVGTL